MNTEDNIMVDVDELSLVRSKSEEVGTSSSISNRTRSSSMQYETQAAASEESENVLTDTPVIGILTAIRDYGEFNSYIMCAYAKFMEQTGAKVVPIKQMDSDEEILALMEKINGVIFPGGSSVAMDDNGLTFYGKKQKLIMDKAKEMNERGIHFPLWGICLGFELMTQHETGVKESLTLDAFDSVDICDQVIFKMDPSQTRQFRDMPKYLLEAMQTENITYNTHHDGVYPSVYEEYPELKENYQVIATTLDRKGVEYVAIVEHKRYPFYAHQYHPEKIQFIFKPDLMIPRSENAVALAKFQAEFFAQECRMNGNKFNSKEEMESTLIQNYPVLFTTGVSQDIYGFNEKLN